jgi:glycogen operon protein
MDGEGHNRSSNHGAEGDTEDPDVIALRERQKRNFITTLALSLGVPMILGGDEMSRTQHGNNNAYCQDNEISWYDWSQRDEHLAMLGFTRRLMEFRKQHPIFRRRRFFQGREIHGSGVSDIGWFNPDGEEMTDEQWNAGFAKSIGIFLNGEEIPDPDEHGERIVDDCFLLMFNAGEDQVTFTLPAGRWGEVWETALDTNEPLSEDAAVYKAGDDVSVENRSIVVLRRAD